MSSSPLNLVVSWLPSIGPPIVACLVIISLGYVIRRWRKRWPPTLKKDSMADVSTGNGSECLVARQTISNCESHTNDTASSGITARRCSACRHSFADCKCTVVLYRNKNRKTNSLSPSSDVVRTNWDNDNFSFIAN